MKWPTLYHNGKEIPQWLGILIALDQFMGSFVPGADVDRTISHRLGVKRVRVALRQGLIKPEAVQTPQGVIRPSYTYSAATVKILRTVRIPFWRHPLAAVIDYVLDRIDPGHSLKSIGA